MRKNRSFHADIGRAVTAAIAAEDCEDIDAALADAVTSLDSYAFRMCSKLTGNLTLPNSVESIGVAAFHLDKRDSSPRQ